MRKNLCLGFVGVNRTGKSSTALLIANNYHQNKKRNKIFVHDPQNVFSKIKSEKIATLEDFKKISNVKNSLIILDEIKMLLPYPQHVPQELTKMLAMSHYNNNDILYIVHNPALIPEILTFYTSHYFIFLTFSREGSFKKKIPNYLLATSAASKVNHYVQINGRGNYPNFPHAVVDCERQKIFLQNMTK